MNKRLISSLLAFVLILQIFIPSITFAKEDTGAITDENLINIGEVSTEEYPSIDTKLILERNREVARNRKQGIVKRGVTLKKSDYISGGDPSDSDKPKYFGRVSAELITKGLDNGEFNWGEIFGKDSSGAKKPVRIEFHQLLNDVPTGIQFSLEVDKNGTYSWKDGNGNETLLPLYSIDFKAFKYSVFIDKGIAEKVKLIISLSAPTPDVAFQKEGDRYVADIKFKIDIQQVAATNFSSVWKTDVAEADRPQIIGKYVFTEDGDDIETPFNFPKNETSRTVIRDGFVENFVPDETNDILAPITDELINTPTEVKVDETNANGLTFDTTNKTVKSGDHKFKYDFKYDVIDGGKLTMTEILPVTFDANGGKFASITEPNAEQKIVKEVDYEGTLTDKAEDPTKERETFKGWSTTADGKTPATDADFSNIKEAKTFYAIWDNNDITAEEFEVKESFKDGTGYVNDFIPTLDKLKGQVKIKDASGTPQALKDTDKLEILDDSGKPIADADLKDKLYEKLKEDPNTEVSRDVTVKAKVTRTDGIIQEVTIPIKVVKNIYEAKTLTEKPFYVPDDYVKVTVDPTTKATDPQKTYYYVNPAAKVVIPGKDPTAISGFKFINWTTKEDIAKGEGSEYKLSEKPRTKFEKASTITAQYSADVIPQEGDTKPEGVPDNFVKITFVPTDNGTMEGAKIFWVNPEKEVTIPVKDPVGKQYFTFKEWKFGEKADGDKYDPTVPTQFKEATTITATYNDSKDIIPVDPTKPTAKPEGYVTVTFDADLGLKLTGTKYYYVKANAGITLAQLAKPKYQAANGYAFDGWDKPDTTPIGKDDIVVTALAKFTPSKPDDRPGRPYPEVIYRDKIVEKEKIVEKIVKVGDNDELLKEIRYMQGFNGKFRPYDGLTRAEAAQILANALKADGYRYDANYALSYSDVGSKWYTDAVRVVTQANVFQGYSDGTFRPQGKITRAEWVATLRRFQDLKKASGNTMMLRSGHWATEEVEAAYQAGWLGVYQDGTAKFDADKPITRQEVAYVSNRAFRRVLDKIYLKRSVNTLLTYKDINPSMPLYEDILCASNTLLTDGRYYKANTIVMDNVTFNIVTDYLKISQKKFQYNVIR